MPDLIPTAAAHEWCCAKLPDFAHDAGLLVRKYGTRGALRQILATCPAFQELEPWQQGLVFISLCHIGRQQAERN